MSYNLSPEAGATVRGCGLYLFGTLGCHMSLVRTVSNALLFVTLSIVLRLPSYNHPSAATSLSFNV